MRAKLARVSGRVCGLAAIAALVGLAAHANDSTAELRAGGLHLTRSDVIDMVSEDLFLSTKEVRVKYVYRNTSRCGGDNARGLPAARHWLGIRRGACRRCPDPASPNFVDFQHKAWMGKDIPLDVEMRAVLDSGLDVTERVKAAGLPFLVTDFEAWDAAAGQRCRWRWRRSFAMKAWSGSILSPIPARSAICGRAWTLKTTFHRMQTFPAGKDVVVEHVYKPVVGGSVGASYVYAQPEDEGTAIRKPITASMTRSTGALDRMKAVRRQGRADQRAHDGLCAHHRRQLGQAHRHLPPHDREGFTRAISPFALTV